MHRQPPKHFRSPAGALRIEIVSARVLTSTMSGRMDLELARHLLKCLETWVELGGDHLLAFHDWSEVADYDSTARDFLTPWSRANRTKFDRVHILVANRIVAFGISVVNALTRDVMKVHASRATFDAARKNAV